MVVCISKGVKEEEGEGGGEGEEEGEGKEKEMEKGGRFVVHPGCLL